MWERIGAVFVLLGLAVAVGAWTGYRSAVADAEDQTIAQSVTAPNCAAARVVPNAMRTAMALPASRGPR